VTATADTDVTEYREPTARSGLEHLVEDLEQALDAGQSRRLLRGEVPREPLKPATVPGLMRMAIEEWLMLGAIWAGMWLLPWWAYPALALLAAGRLHALGILMHDASHMAIRGKTVGVRLLEVLCAYPIATTLNAMRYHHLRHHRDSGMPSDPYYKRNLKGRPLMWVLNVVRGAVLIPFWTVRAPFGLLAVAFPGMRNAYGRVFLQDRSGEDLTHSREVVDCGRAELGQVLFQAPVIAAIALWPRELLLAYVIPVTITGLMAAWRLLVEHNYEPAEDRRIETILATTNDHHLGWWNELLLAPRNIGYHVIHHIHPQVGLTQLPAIRRWWVEHHPDRYPEAR